MFRLLFRFIGWLFLAAGFVTIVINGTQSIAANHLIVSSFGETTQRFSGTLASQIQSSLMPSTAHFFWKPLIEHLFLVPTFAAFMILGCILILVTGKREKTIGFSSRP